MTSDTKCLLSEISHYLSCLNVTLLSTHAWRKQCKLLCSTYINLTEEQVCFYEWSPSHVHRIQSWHSVAEPLHTRSTPAGVVQVKLRGKGGTLCVFSQHISVGRWGYGLICTDDVHLNPNRERKLQSFWFVSQNLSVSIVIFFPHLLESLKVILLSWSCAYKWLLNWIPNLLRLFLWAK